MTDKSSYDTGLGLGQGYSSRESLPLTGLYGGSGSGSGIGMDTSKSAVGGGYKRPRDNRYNGDREGGGGATDNNPLQPSFHSPPTAFDLPHTTSTSSNDRYNTSNSTNRYSNINTNSRDTNTTALTSLSSTSHHNPLLLPLRSTTSTTTASTTSFNNNLTRSTTDTRGTRTSVVPPEKPSYAPFSGLRLDYGMRKHTAMTTSQTTTAGGGGGRQQQQHRSNTSSFFDE